MRSVTAGNTATFAAENIKVCFNKLMLRPLEKEIESEALRILYSLYDIYCDDKRIGTFHDYVKCFKARIMDESGKHNSVEEFGLDDLAIKYYWQFMQDTAKRIDSDMDLI